jgi:hypothetical protein
MADLLPKSELPTAYRNHVTLMAEEPPHTARLEGKECCRAGSGAGAVKGDVRASIPRRHDAKRGFRHR